MSKTPVILWFRRDLRLSDHAALTAAAQAGRPVIPVFIHDDTVAGLGAAPRWRLGLGLGLQALAQALNAQGSRLILRKGAAVSCLRALVTETGAGAVYWSRLYEPQTVASDMGVETTLLAEGLEARSFGGHLLFEPGTVCTKTGGPYKVFTPFWNSVRGREVPQPLPVPARIVGPDRWPASDALVDWHMDQAMHRGAAIVHPYVRLGEPAALARLDAFGEGIIGRYTDTRDLPAVDGTSALSENLTYGEISPHRCWHAGLVARQEGKPGAETFLKQLVWRDFAHHLMYHTPHILTRNWKPDWDTFPWNTDADHPDAKAWKQGRTGIPFVDAAMREMYVTGRIHNRGRMIVASYLTKHLMCHWRIGQAWFEDCLIDWDAASNAMGWQWSAGSGPDAAPYFRVFNPVTQLAKFDPEGGYVRRWIAEGHPKPSASALSYFEAVPQHWGLRATDPYPAPIVTAEAGRRCALTAYENRN